MKRREQQADGPIAAPACRQGGTCDLAVFEAGQRRAFVPAMPVRRLVLVFVAFAACAAVASASVVPRTATLETGDFSQFDATNWVGGTLTVSTSTAYEGIYSAKATYNGGPNNGFERGIYWLDWPDDWPDGTDVWYGAAFYFPPGFYAAQTGYLDIMRWDNWPLYGSPGGDTGGIAIYGSDHKARLLREHYDGSGLAELVGPFSLPEGKWFWLEVHQRLSGTDGAAYSEVLLDGVSLGTSSVANTFGRTIDRIRYGIVAVAPSRQPGPLTLYFDRASVSVSELGPSTSTTTTTRTTTTTSTTRSTTTTTTSSTTTTIMTTTTATSTSTTTFPRTSYRDTILGTSGLVSYWRLDEASGTTAADQKGANPGTYVGGVTLAQPGALIGDSDTAAAFDGMSGEMAAGGPALTSAGTIEGWFYWTGGYALMRDNTSSGGWILADNNGGYLSYRVGGTTFTTTKAAASVQNGWHYLALTDANGSTAFYVDGALVKSANGAGSTKAVMPWHVMRTGSSTGYASGRADEIAVYNSALPATTIRQHYHAGGY